MNKIVKAVGLIALAAIVVVTLGSCDLTAAMTVTGKVVNVRAPSTQTQFWKGTTNTAATLEGATITMTNKKDNSTETGTVGSDGTFSINSVKPGKYTISGSGSGWSFVDREVDITGYFTTLPDVLAFETPADLNEILVMVEWTNTAMDVDSYMTRDISDNSGYDGTIIAGFATGITGGVGSTETGTYGQYYYDTNSPRKVKLERDIIQVNASDPNDVKLPRVETIHISGPINATAWETLRYYIRLYNYASTGTLTGNGSGGASAEATVFVVQGTTNMGTFKIAVNSNEIILGVLQMQWDTADHSWSIGSYSNPGFDSGDWTNLLGVRSIGSGIVQVGALK